MITSPHLPQLFLGVEIVGLPCEPLALPFSFSRVQYSVVSGRAEHRFDGRSRRSPYPLSMLRFDSVISRKLEGITGTFGSFVGFLNYLLGTNRFTLGHPLASKRDLGVSTKRN